jgi:signal transduction histidine kinase
VQLKQLTDSLKKNLQTEDSLRFPAGVNGKASKDASAFVHHKTAITNLQLLNELSSTLQMVNARESSILENTRGFLKQRVSGFQSYSLTVTVLTVVFLFGVATVAARNIIFTNAYQQQVITEKTEKMAEAKTRFLSNVSHEVRSPLSIIIGFAEQLKNEGDTTMNLQYVCAIHRAAEHLLHTVDDILDFSKLEAGKLELDNQPFDPAAIAKDTTELYQVQARKKGLQLFCDIDLPTDFFVQGDAFRLQQVLLNLVSNALKFTDKGFVQLTLHLQQQQNDNCVLLFTVRDTGVGIATADLQKIFEEFEQSAAKKARERSVRGTGLGLSICKMLVQLQGGTIQVNSKINEGSTFTVALPFTLSQQKPVTATREIQRACVPKGKILLIEDDEMNVLLFSHLLKRYGYPFDIAADGRQAIDMINRNTYHLILTDIDLPFYSGIEITRFVREHKHAGIAATPIVALTANIMQEYTDAFSSAGMNGYITKPVKEHDFIEKIARYL